MTVRDRRFLLRVETSEEPGDYRKYEDLREEIWRFAEDHMSSARNMMCENVWHEGAQPLYRRLRRGARGRFRGRRVGPGRILLRLRRRRATRRSASATSPTSASTPSTPGSARPFQSYGLGLLLKEFQREMVLGLLGVSTIICTYDPLTGVNAHRNVHHFGMDVLEYRVATYGEYGGLLNRPDVPTDRFLMSWDLERTGGRPCRAMTSSGAPAAPGRPSGPGSARVAGKSSGARARGRGRDRSRTSTGEVLLVRIPLDFYRMLQETDVAGGGRAADPRRLEAGHAARSSGRSSAGATGSSISSKAGPGSCAGQPLRSLADLPLNRGPRIWHNGRP
ncbi:MAG: hypothetical protein MZV64_63775 [Ignavibacteriales bacterium]|nr:hypothetical protein [Ignavibacteriales bacterium]